MLDNQAVIDLLDDMPRGVPWKDAEKAKPSGALWSGADDLRPHVCSPLDGDRIINGKVGNAWIGVQSDMHMNTFAATRAGKGVSAIIPALLTYKGSMVAMAPKSENPDLTARVRAERLGQKVFLIDPFLETKSSLAKYRARFNPLSILKPGSKTLVADARLLADSIVIPEGGSAVHWDESARSVISAILLHVATFPDYGARRNLNTVRDLLLNGRTFTTSEGETLKGMAGLWAEMQSSRAARNVVSGAGSSFAQKSVNEAAAILSTARRHCDFLDIEGIQDVLEGDDIDFRDLKRQAMTLYFDLPATRLTDCSRLLRMGLNMLMLAVEQEKTKPALPVIALIDEFHSLGTVRLVEVASGLVAGYGLRLWTIFQDLNQLQGLYKSWETFLANSGVIQCFGLSDLTSLRWVSEKLGTTSVMAQGSREVSLEDRVKQGVTGSGKSHNMAALLEPHEVGIKVRRNDHKRRQFLLLPGEKPIVLSRAVSFLDSPFKELVDTD